MKSIFSSSLAFIVQSSQAILNYYSLPATSGFTSSLQGEIKVIDNRLSTSDENEELEDHEETKSSVTASSTVGGGGGNDGLTNFVSGFEHLCVSKMLVS